jgi:hypothetical protein
LLSLATALVSKEWLKSSWCKSEVDAARLVGMKVIVALVGIDKSEVPPDLLRFLAGRRRRSTGASRLLLHNAQRIM